MHLRVWAALSLALVLLIGCGGGQTNLQEPNVDRTVTDDTALPQPTMSAAAAQAAATGLIGAMPEGGAEAIASRGEVSGDEEMLDRAAMEFGTD